jgi:predicted ATPase
MVHLKTVSMRKWTEQENSLFPFNLPIIQALQEINFISPVTFLVGENGSGKSTLLEALACAIGSTTVGSESVKTDKTLNAVRRFSLHMKLSWQKRTQRGFFLRAEDFFGYSRRLSEIRQEMEEEIRTVEQEYVGRSKFAQDLGKLPYANELQAMRQRYGDGLDTYSHGESFLKLFQSRFVPNGLYLLDEPEAPLSPIRQLAFISALKNMVVQDAQFIIATHSPIIMAFPNAVILSFDSSHIQQVRYEELEHVKLTKAFLNNPEAYLNHL